MDDKMLKYLSLEVRQYVLWGLFGIGSYYGPSVDAIKRG